MILIGEKINGAIPSVAKAIAGRDAAFIEDLVRKQDAAGADYIDVCAGTKPELEAEALRWLIGVVQSATEKPICLDSPDPRVLADAMPLIQKPGILNSISGEGGKCDILLPLLRDNPEWKAVALCCDDGGIAVRAEDKFSIAARLLEKSAAYGVTPDRVFIDPLVLAVSAAADSAMEFCAALRRLREYSPEVHLAAALSNVSYGMPERRLLNRTFLSLAMSAGLDSLICDPLRKELIETIYATEALLGKDRCCRNYNKAYRAGKIGNHD